MSRPPLPSDAFALGRLTVVPSLNRLLDGARATDLEPRVMAVLAALAATPAEVVSRAHLFETVWPDTVVGDEALTRAVSELRKALADGAPDAIETIRGTGYRLVAPVRPIGPSASPRATDDRPATPQRSLVALALGLAALALAVAVWAAWPRVTPTAPTDTSANGLSTDSPSDDAVTRLDSTSEYFREGLSDLGVYHDSTEDRYFEFVEPDARDHPAAPPRVRSLQP